MYICAIVVYMFFDNSALMDAVWYALLYVSHMNGNHLNTFFYKYDTVHVNSLLAL